MNSNNKRPRLHCDSSAAPTRTTAAAASATSTTPTKPQLTRACAECKKHKIKCFTQPGHESCNKCLKSGISCVPYNFAQKFLDEDTTWKNQTSSTIEQLKATVEYLLRQNNLAPDITKYDGTATSLSSATTAATTDSDATCSIHTVSPSTTTGTDYVPSKEQSASMSASAHPNTRNTTTNTSNNNPAQTNGAGAGPPPPPPPTTTTSNPPGNFLPEGPSDSDLRGNPDLSDSDLVPHPMSNLYALTTPSSLSRLIRVDPASANGPDFISRGVVSISEAEFLFDHFLHRINPLLWDGILCSHHPTLHSARTSSSLLTATVLTVAALHRGDREASLRKTYDAFVNLMRGSCLLHSRNLDDVRGLCIGAFYLTSLSWALCSRAVRVATEMGLHKASLQFAQRGSVEGFERVRLWYVLYVCSAQFSLAYGRPPLMHEDAAIRNADKLLASGLSSKGDRRLVAQVKLFRILAGAYFLYGCDADLSLGGEDFEVLQSFNVSVDQWRLENHQAGKDRNGGGGGGANGGALGTQTSSSSSSSSLSTVIVPAKETILYYNLARFQLNSLSLRGISAGTSGSVFDWDRQEAANNAISAAMNTVRLVAEDGEIRRAMIGMPIFTHAMIAVCASFLLKMAVTFGQSTPGVGSHSLLLPRDLGPYGLNFATKNVLEHVDRLVRALEVIADDASQRHVARQVVTGLKELLQRFAPDRSGELYLYSRSHGFGASDAAFNNNTNNNSLVATAAAPEREAQSFRNDGPAAAYNNTSAAAPLCDPPGRNVASDAAPLVATAAPPDLQQDPYDLMGDLDWRFDDSFMWGINSEVQYIS